MFSISRIDAAIMNFVLAVRSESVANALLFFTYLGNWQIIAGLGIVAVIILALLKKWREIILLIGAPLASEAVYQFLKFAIQRPRPEATAALIFESGYAFPSGHAVMSIVFYGIVGYLLSKSLAQKWQRTVLAAAAAALIAVIGFSRVYLGVHWASDVIGGWLLGILILIISIIIFERFKKSAPDMTTKTFGNFISRKMLHIIIAALLAAEGLFAYYFYLSHPLGSRGTSFESALIQFFK